MGPRINLIIFQLFLVIFLKIFSTSTAQTNCPERKHVVCYVASWAYYREGKGMHKLKNIVPQYCTHFVYSFAGLDITGRIQSVDPNYDSTGFKNFINLKERNPCAKFLIAIGGWNEGSEKYSYMVETAENREIFVDSIMRFLVFHGFDGLDLDWEYPTQRGGIPADKNNFIELLKLLKSKFEPRKKTLSIAIPAVIDILIRGFDIENICKNLDFLSVMAYDLALPDQASVHAPLNLESGESRETIDDAIKYILRKGCPPQKVILGITSVAKTFTLKYAGRNDVGAPITGPGVAGKYLKSAGSLSFNEMCEKFNSTGWTHKHRKNNAVKVSYKDTFWAVYDDEETVTQKGQYVLDNSLGGLMFWSIDTDDFLPECHKTKYPLLVAANSALKNNIRSKLN